MRTTLLICGGIAFLFLLGFASACSCVNQEQISLEEAYGDAGAVFLGKVISITPSTTNVFTNIVTFSVNKSWKGIGSVFTTSKDSAACGYSFEVGEEYLVFANEGGTVGLCSKTQRAEDAGEMIRELDSLKSNTAHDSEECRYYFWFDDTNKKCERKQFCGAYMYQGLHTYTTYERCMWYMFRSKANSTVNSGCQNFYYFDNANKNCEQKQFCGMYMYEGLQTFESRDDCQRALNGVSDEYKCNSDSDCACGVWRSNGECAVGNKEFIDVTRQCPDYCTGIAANFVTKCVSNKCTLVNTRDIACTEEAKQCPDGKWVGRNASKNCEFDECSNVYQLSNGRKAEIKIMPETASTRAKEKLGELGFSVELKEAGTDKVAYEVSAEKEGKIFGLFKAKGKVSMQVDAESGEVISVKKPWWSFLASGI